MKKLSLKPSAAATTGHPSPLASGIGALITIIINTALLIWVIRVSAKHCGCVGGWRQEFIKYFAGITIFIGVLRFANSRQDFSGFSQDLPKYAVVVLGLLGLAYLIAVITNMIAVITYVGDINETECECALKGMSGLNKSMIVLRWFYIVMLFIFAGILLGGLLTYFQGRK